MDANVRRRQGRMAYAKMAGVFAIRPGGYGYDELILAGKRIKLKFSIRIIMSGQIYEENNHG